MKLKEGLKSTPLCLYQKPQTPWIVISQSYIIKGNYLKHLRYKFHLFSTKRTIMQLPLSMNISWLIYNDFKMVQWYVYVLLCEDTFSYLTPFESTDEHL